ncbi:MAG: hypothetical protein SFU86_21010 [Pirellulaceae bacterium]|nr:hypothetical protein [Pirellulaceae bacterium]
MQSAKDLAREVLDSLPDDCTLDDISYRLYLRRKLDQSQRDIAAGRVHSEDETREIVEGWFSSSGPTPQSAT